MAFKKKYHEGPDPKYDIHEVKFRAAMSEAIKKSELDRYEIAARISALTGKALSKNMLDKWCSQNKEYGPKPIELLALCAVIQNVDPINYLLKQLNCSLIPANHLPFLKLASIMVEMARTHLVLSQKNNLNAIVEAIFPPQGGSK